MFFSFVTPFSAAFTAGMSLSLSLIVAIGPQNAHLLRMGLHRQHLWLSVMACALADMAMIAVGVTGLAQIGALPERLYGAMLGAAMLLLCLYGWQAARRFWRSRARTTGGDASTPSPIITTKRQAIGQALVFSWLNPHAWIDTAVLIGGASLAYQAEERTGFGLGAMTGSVIWFVTLGALVFWLGRRLGRSRLWHWLDGLVAIMMWIIAATIAYQLLG